MFSEWYYFIFKIAFDFVHCKCYIKHFIRCNKIVVVDFIIFNSQTTPIIRLFYFQNMWLEPMQETRYILYTYIYI